MTRVRYRLVEIEIGRGEPAPIVGTAPDECGVALILRCRGKVVGFGLKPLPPASMISAPALARWIDELVDGRPVPVFPGVDGTTAVSHSTSSPTLSVVVCTRDRPERLRRCLESLLCQRPAGITNPEIVVVDNAPSDERARVSVAELPDVRYCREPVPGLDTARNHALHRVGGELIAYLDDDVVADPSWLANLTEVVRAHPDAGGFTGQVLPLALETRAQVLFEQNGGFRHGFETVRFVERSATNRLYPCAPGSIGVGCNMVFDRALLMELGGFDEALDTGPPLPGGGDLDIFYRVIRHGRAIVYEPGCLVFHEHRRTLAALRAQFWSWGIGFAAFVAKSRRSDPAMRSRFNRLIVWWLGYQARRLARSVRGEHPLPATMVLAELRGALDGFLGGYGRSQVRRKALHARHGSPVKDDRDRERRTEDIRRAPSR